MKKLLLISILIPSISFASVKGIGEYFYGPDTSDNLACSFAEDKAKESAIQNYSGQLIESNIDEVCLTDWCSYVKETNTNTTGIIKSILNKKVHKTVEEGQKVCTVEIDALVQQIQKNLVFDVKPFSNIVKENDEVIFFVIVNKPGKFLLFNYYEGNYHKLYELDNLMVNEQFIVPSKNKLYAVLPKDKLTSKEKLVFVYLTVDISVKKVYNDFEMKKFIGSVPVEKRSTINRFVQIVR